MLTYVKNLVTVGMLLLYEYCRAIQIDLRCLQPRTLRNH